MFEREATHFVHRSLLALFAATALSGNHGEGFLDVDELLGRRLQEGYAQRISQRLSIRI